jgi:hypothetical protein
VQQLHVVLVGKFLCKRLAIVIILLQFVVEGSRLVGPGLLSFLHAGSGVLSSSGSLPAAPRKNDGRMGVTASVGCSKPLQHFLILPPIIIVIVTRFLGG